MRTPPLASGPDGPDAPRPLLDTVLDARARGGPLPAGGPQAVTARVTEALGDLLPDHGDPDALHTLVHTLAAGALNPSLDSWDQAPAATALETQATRTLAAVRRTLLPGGRAVLGRTRLDGRLWLKATILNPRTRPLTHLLELVEGSTPP